MGLFLASLAVLLAGAVLAPMAGRGRAANFFGATGAFLGSLLGLAFACLQLAAGGEALSVRPLGHAARASLPGR